MPDEQGVGEVRPIYRRGDCVLVKLPLCFYVLVIHASEVIGGELWFYGRGADIILPFPATCIVCRIDAGEGST